MLFKKEKEVDKRINDAFDATMDVTEGMIRDLRLELMDLILALAVATKTTPKKLATIYDVKTLTKFAESLVLEVNKRIVEEKKKAQKLISKK